MSMVWHVVAMCPPLPGSTSHCRCDALRGQWHRRAGMTFRGGVGYTESVAAFGPRRRRRREAEAVLIPAPFEPEAAFRGNDATDNDIAQAQTTGGTRP